MGSGDGKNRKGSEIYLLMHDSQVLARRFGHFGTIELKNLWTADHHMVAYFGTGDTSGHDTKRGVKHKMRSRKEAYEAEKKGVNAKSRYRWRQVRPWPYL